MDMKKRLCYLFLILALFVFIPDVYADDYKINELIPVNTVASVETDKFDYKNFVYDPTIDGSGNASIKFEGIQNNTLSKTAVSIDVLLFDEQKKNIGFLTYCTDKDISSENAGFKIRANQVVPFTIPVTSRYFAKGKAPADVKYIAVRDENRYCQIGGYTNFEGLTIEEIVNGVNTEEQGGFSLPDLSSIINPKVIIIFVVILVAIAAITGVLKLLKILGRGAFNRARTVKNVVRSDANSTVSVNPEANKPIDLDSLYETSSAEDSVSSLTANNHEEDVTSLEDIFTPTASSVDTSVNTSIPEVPVETNTNTNAVSVESLYNTISELPEEKKETDHSIDDLYNSINGANDPDNKESSSSIDDLYESINTEEDDDEDIMDE